MTTRHGGGVLGRWMRGIPLIASERPALFVFTVALCVRLIGVAIALSLPDGTLALDDLTYERIARTVVAGQSGSLSSAERALFDRTSTFMVPISAAYWLFGAVDFVPRALVTAAGAGSAALVTALLRPKVELRWALAAGLTVAVMPSQIVWSSLLLKDSTVWLVSAALGVVAVRWATGQGDGWIAHAAWMATLLFLLGHLRLHSTAVLAWSFAATIVAARWRAWTNVIVVLVVAMAVPWLAGGGPGGLDPLLSHDLEELRTAAAAGAESAFVDPVMPEGGESAQDAAGVESLQLLRGLEVMLFEPVPWAEHRSLRHALAKLDNLLWYPVLLFAAAGITSLRRHWRILLFPTLTAGGLLVGYALTEGNVGTAFRHRGELLWAVAVVATFGSRRLWAQVEAHRRRHT